MTEIAEGRASASSLVTPPDNPESGPSRASAALSTDDRQAAEAMYRSALDRGETLSGAELGRRFDRPERWGRRIVASVRADTAATPASTNGNHRTPDTGRADTKPPDGRTPRPARTRTRRADTGQVPGPFVVVTGLGVALVAAVTAVASYVHLRHLAQVADLGSLASWLPLGVDGLAVACTASLLVDRQRGRRPDRLAVIGLVLGLAGSVAGNLAAVDPELVEVRTVRLILAAYPPLALSVAGHLLARMILGERK